jgi:hypothetical protein
MITVHDPTGRTIGMLSPSRAQTLYHNYQQTLAGRPHLATALQAKPFPEELAHLLLRYKQGTKVPGSKRKVNLQNHLGHPPEHLPDHQETHTWTHPRKVCQPLNYHPDMTRILELL